MIDYKKQVNDNYTLHLINTTRFKQINISVRFTKSYEKNTGAYLKLLERILPFNGNKKYKRIKDINKKLESLYRTSLTSTFFCLSKNMTFEINRGIVNPKYTEDTLLHDSCEMLREILFNPKIEDEQFNGEVFEIEKENLIKSILNVKDSPDTYGRLKFEEKFLSGTVYAENNYKNIKLFENLENKELYQIYKSLFTDYKVDILVCGDFENLDIQKEISFVMKDVKQNDKTNKDLYYKIKKKEKLEEKESMQIMQSSLFVGCTIDNLTEEERNYRLILYNTILGSMNNSVLFMNVREKNSLCYHVGSYINRFTDTIEIESGINKKNYEKTLSIIDECLRNMEDKKVIETNIVNAKKTIEIAQNDFYDNMNKIMTYYFMNEFTNIPSIEERRLKVKDVTVDEICELAKKVRLSYVFLLEGVNEKN